MAPFAGGGYSRLDMIDKNTQEQKYTMYLQ